MNAKALTILLVGTDAELAPLIRETLAAGGSSADRILNASDPAGALSAAGRESADIVLVASARSAQQTDDTVRAMRQRLAELPLVAITESEEDPAGAAALAAGADDHFPRAHLRSPLLARSLRYAVERRRLQQTLRELSLTDDDTGLYNLRGFMTLAEHHTRLATRTRGLLVGSFQMDTSGAPSPADDLQALSRWGADLLRAAFRASDVLARVAEREFAVLAVDAAPAAAPVIQQRMVRLLGEQSDDVPTGFRAAGVIVPAAPLSSATELLSQLQRLQGERRPIGAAVR